MFETVAFKAEHLLPLLKENMNKRFEEFFINGLAFELEKSNSVTFLYDERAMVCGGIKPIWEGRGQVWTIFSESSKTHFLPTFRAISRWLKYQIDNNYRRIELSVDCDFPIGKRRAEMLGFSLDILCARRYLPDGRDCSIYSMVRE